MKRAIIVMVALALVSFAVGQQSPASPSKGTPNTATPGAAATQTAPAAGATAPQGKTPPQAKTQAEYDAFNAAKANAGDAANLEKAADDFAAKFPESELRILLYEADVAAYQQSNNSAKMEEVGKKVLAIDPDQPDALVAVSQGLVDTTQDSDIDKDQKYAEAAKDAQHALETIDTDIAVPAGTPPDRVETYKDYIRSTAHSFLGTIMFKKGDFVGAQAEYQKSLDAFPSQPDPLVVLRLALCLDNQKKYPEALQQANKAVALTQENTTAGNYARRERDRLVQLTGGTVAPATPAPATPAKPN
ncbi:MAG TPA: tetratricopeptide repeat protein [Terriglobales bacterium]|nr:tetratricopeptide repeat protein [Terriglobales bacterium]